MFLRKSNKDLLDRLSRCTENATTEAILKSANSHTQWLYRNGFTSDCLPSYKNNHRRVVHAIPNQARSSVVDLLRAQGTAARLQQQDSEDRPENNNKDDKEIENDPDSVVEVTNSEEIVESINSEEIVDITNSEEIIDTLNIEEIDDISTSEHEPREETVHDEENNFDVENTSKAVTSTAEVSNQNDSGVQRADAEYGEGEETYVPLMEHVDKGNEDSVGEKEMPKVELTDECVRKLAETVVKALKIDNSKTEQSDEETWIDAEDHFICRPCATLAQSTLVPKPLESYRRGAFGIVKKNQRNAEVARTKQKHISNDLHKWCLAKEKADSFRKKNIEEEDRKNGEKVILNVLHCLKHGQSSIDFLALNNLDHLTSNSAAVKNNSKAAFFEIRDIIYEVVTEKIHFLFNNPGLIMNISVSLDKVTVFNIPYLAVCTYYFFGGRLRVLINGLIIMEEDDYSGQGTAEVVGKFLMETLGISKSRLSLILRHMPYDGVYATTAQRTAGGGSLNLIRWMEMFLGVEEGSITGTWDISHLMQIVFRCGLLENVSIKAALDFYVDVMGEHRVGKQAVIFSRFAAEEGALVVTNKKHQTTRYVLK